MLRRFSTAGVSQAMARSSRMAPRSTARPRAANATKPTTSTPASARANPPVTSASALGTQPPVNQSLGKSPPAQPASSHSTEISADGFIPRLVPELHNKPTSTLVKDVIDEDEVVDSLASLEVEEGLGEDWTTSFQGLGQKPFDRQAIDILMSPVVPEDVEVTPDGLIYLPEIKYRRILNRAFGPGGWGIAPRTKTLVTKRQVTREYGLVCLGRLVSVSRGEMDFFSAEGVTTAMEGCKSNALMRCCKDLGIASELWDPAFIREFKQKKCESKYFEKKRRFVWKRKDRPWEYPYNQ